MKHFLLIAFFFSTVQACNTASPDIAFEKQGTEKLKKDLVVLHDLLENVHPGVFAYTGKVAFDRLFDSISRSIDLPLTKSEFLDKVDFIIDQIHCAHTSCYFPDDFYDTLSARKYFFPLPLIKINDRIFLNSEMYNLANGSEILSINEHTVREILDKFLYHTHADGLSKDYKGDAVSVDFAYNYFLAFGPAEKFRLQYKESDTTATESITVYPESLYEVTRLKSTDIYYSFPPDIPYDLKIENDGKAAVLTIRTFDHESVSQNTAYSNFLENSFSLIRLKGIKNVIIDYRNNPGGYFKCSYELLSYFITAPLMEFDSAVKRFERLPFKEYVTVGDSSMELQIDTGYNGYSRINNRRYDMKAGNIDTCIPAKHIYKGRLFIITNGNVISAAASSAALLKEKAGAIIVGEETGGSYAAFNSAILSYTLPNTGIKIDIPTVRYYPPVKQLANINGVKPDHYLPVTRENFTSFSDGPLHLILDSLIH